MCILKYSGQSRSLPLFKRLRAWRAIGMSPRRPYIVWRTSESSRAPSTRIRIFLNPQLFLSGYGYRSHAYGEFASKSGNFWIRSPVWNFFNPIIFRIRVDGRIFSDTMSSQNWRQYLPRKFIYGRRSKANSLCAPWAYFQSFSLYGAKCRSTKCRNKLCQKATWHLQALHVIYRTKRPAETT